MTDDIHVTQPEPAATSPSVGSPLGDDRAHREWLDAQERDLLRFGQHVVRPDGLAAWLDDRGRPDPGKPVLTWVTARMAHVYFLGALREVPGSYELADRLLGGLTDRARDHRHGGWLDQQPPAGALAEPEGPDKHAYTHAFVVLAAATATYCRHPQAGRLLDEALSFTVDRFGEAGTPLFVDGRSADFSTTPGYRGINANMHMVEALLAAADATGDDTWAERAAAICRFVIEQARANHWRIPEHYDTTWTADLDHNADRPDDQFQPYGATVGHAFEWARLMVQARPNVDSAQQALFLAAAEQLTARAVADGWGGADQPGFVYTTGWDGVPLVRDRLHWVTAEAIAVAATLWRATGHPRYQTSYRQWWDYAAAYLVDTDHGSWRHQLDPQNRASTTIWDGKPDLYHAYQTVLLSQLPTSRSIAAAAAAPASRSEPGSTSLDLTTGGGSTDHVRSSEDW